MLLKRASAAAAAVRLRIDSSNERMKASASPASAGRPMLRLTCVMCEPLVSAGGAHVPSVLPDVSSRRPLGRPSASSRAPLLLLLLLVELTSVALPITTKPPASLDTFRVTISVRLRSPVAASVTTDAEPTLVRLTSSESTPASPDTACRNSVVTSTDDSASSEPMRRRVTDTAVTGCALAVAVIEPERVGLRDAPGDDEGGSVAVADDVVVLLRVLLRVARGVRVPVLVGVREAVREAVSDADAVTLAVAEDDAVIKAVAVTDDVIVSVAVAVIVLVVEPVCVVLKVLLAVADIVSLAEAVLVALVVPVPDGVIVSVMLAVAEAVPVSLPLLAAVLDAVDDIVTVPEPEPVDDIVAVMLPVIRCWGAQRRDLESSCRLQSLSVSWWSSSST